MDNIQIIKRQPMDDGDLKFYDKDIEIITYNDLTNFNSIEELLDKPLDYTIILIEFKPNEGHWIGLLKYGKTIEFFDSYGKNPTYWLGKSALNLNPKILKKLLDKALEEGYNVVYNKIQYQLLKDQSVATCGRHLLNRIKMLKEFGLNSDDYYKVMYHLKKMLGISYDELVSSIVSKF